MQRNILKMTLICGLALFLAAAPVHPVTAAQDAIDADTQNTDHSKLREIYYVTAQNGLKMRSSPSKDSDVITLLPYGVEVTVIEPFDSGWYEIEYGNDSGYVAAKYLAKSDNEDGDSDNEAAGDSESIPQTESTSEGIQSSFGAAPIIAALIAAIIIMAILAIFTAYSFLKKEKNNYHNDDVSDDDSVDDDYVENNNIYDNTEYYGNDDTNYDNDGDYDDEEYYDDEE